MTETRDNVRYVSLRGLISRTSDMLCRFTMYAGYQEGSALCLV